MIVFTRIVVSSILGFIVFMLSSCATYESMKADSQEQARCKATCQQRLHACTQTCQSSCPDCCVSANQRTARDYNHYKNQQRVQGSAIVRQLNAYRDPLQCRKTTCDCPTDYRTCIQTCTGKVPKRLQVAPVC